MPDRYDLARAGALPASELLALAGGGTEPEVLGVLHGRSAVLVQVDADPALPRLARLLRQCPCVTVGVADPGWWSSNRDRVTPDLDLLLVDDPEPPAPWVGGGPLQATLDQIRENVARWPAAAIALVQLLRLGSQLELGDALVAESMVYSLLQSGSDHRRWLEGRRPRRRTAPEGPAVVVSRTGARGEDLSVELHRPEVRNAFNTEMRDQLVTAFDLATLDRSIERVEVRGAGPSFCSGGDLAEFGSAPEPPRSHLIRTSRSAARSLAGCAPKTTFFVHGASVGAGVELAALAGRVSADPDATFCLPELTMGLIPGAGGTATLPRRTGRQRTAYLGLSAGPIDATRALAWGLIDEIRTSAGG